MGITKDEIIKLHPQLYHMAEEGTWPSIRENGLLSTSALLDRFEITGNKRAEIERRNRRRSTLIKHPEFGSAVIRDQFPMTDTALEKCLINLTPEEWYIMLNARVFFWTTADRLNTLFNARAYRGKTQCIITIDTQTFLEKYADLVTLSPLNSGSTIYKPQPRGHETFLPLSDFPFDHWKKKRSKATKAIVEVTVEHGVPDICKYVTDVTHMKNGEVIENIAL